MLLLGLLSPDQGPAQCTCRPSQRRAGNSTIRAQGTAFCACFSLKGNHITLLWWLSHSPTDGSWNHRRLLFPSWRLESKIRCLQGWFLLRPLFLACRWPSSPCVPTWSSLCVLISSYQSPWMRTQGLGTGLYTVGAL